MLVQVSSLLQLNSTLTMPAQEPEHLKIDEVQRHCIPQQNLQLWKNQFSYCVILQFPLNFIDPNQPLLKLYFGLVFVD